MNIVDEDMVVDVITKLEGQQAGKSGDAPSV